jgi:hypothetical protein
MKRHVILWTASEQNGLFLPEQQQRWDLLRCTMCIPEEYSSSFLFDTLSYFEYHFMLIFILYNYFRLWKLNTQIRMKRRDGQNKMNQE